MPVSLVTPSTRPATSSPNSARTSSSDAVVSSTVSCSSAAHSVSVSSRMPAQIFATPTGWTMKSSPDWRRWSAWCSQANTNALMTLPAVDLAGDLVGVLLDDREQVGEQLALERGEVRRGLGGRRVDVVGAVDLLVDRDRDLAVAGRLRRGLGPGSSARADRPCSLATESVAQAPVVGRRHAAYDGRMHYVAIAALLVLLGAAGGAGAEPGRGLARATLKPAALDPLKVARQRLQAPRARARHGHADRRGRRDQALPRQAQRLVHRHVRRRSKPATASRPSRWAAGAAAPRSSSRRSAAPASSSAHPRRSRRTPAAPRRGRTASRPSRPVLQSVALCGSASCSPW